MTRKKPVITAMQIKKFRKNPGLTESQICFSTKKIEVLEKHFKIHKKDFSSGRQILKEVGKRNRMLRYLYRNSEQRYLSICKLLGLRIKIF